MADKKLTRKELEQKNEELQLRLEEAEETLRAIREGEVDALIVSGSKGEQVFSLSGADAIYRRIVETMKEAALTVTFYGKILYCNTQFSLLIGRSPEQIIGHALEEFVAADYRKPAASLAVEARDSFKKQRLVFGTADGRDVPAHVAANLLDDTTICMVASDLTELENSTELIQQLKTQREKLQVVNEELTTTEEELRAQTDELIASQEALRKSEERIRTVLENSRDGINMLDLKTGKYIFMSPAQVKLTGFSMEELRDLSAEDAYERVHPDDREISIAQQKQAAAGLDPGIVEYRWKVKSGEYRWFSDSRSLARDAQGRPLYMVGVSRDITARRQAEEALLESRNQFAVLIQNVEAGVALINEDGQFAIVNPAFLRLFDLPGDSDIKNVNDRDWGQWHVFNESGELLDVDEHPVRKAAVTGIAVRNRLVGVRSPLGGPIKWMLISAEPILKQDGRRGLLICTYHDITGRKQAEEILRESEAKYRSLFQQMLEGFAYCEMLYDEQGRPEDLLYLAVNDAFGKLTGLENVIGRRITEVIPQTKELHPELLEIYGRVASTGNPEQFEIYFRPLSKLLSISAYSPAKGHFVAVFSDITERRKMEEELKESRAELEIRVQERTRELSDAVGALGDEIRQRVAAERDLRERSDLLRSLASELTLTEQRERMRLAQILHDGLQQILVAAKYRVIAAERGQNLPKANG